MRVPEPALATLSHERFWEPGWVYERKLDGQRCLAVRDGRGTRLYSRSGRDVTVAFPEIAEALEEQAATRFVVDGEVVASRGRAPASPASNRGSISPVPPRRGPPGSPCTSTSSTSSRSRVRTSAPSPARPQAAVARAADLGGADPLDASPRQGWRGVVRRDLRTRLGGPDRQACRRALRHGPDGPVAEVQVRGRAGADRRRLDRTHRVASCPGCAPAGAPRPVRRERRPGVRRQGRHRILRPGPARPPREAVQAGAG